MKRTSKAPLFLAALILVALVLAFTPAVAFAHENNGYPKPPPPSCDYHHSDDDDCYEDFYYHHLDDDDCSQKSYYQHHDDDCYNQVYYNHHDDDCYNQAYYQHHQDNCWNQSSYIHHHNDDCRHQASYYHSKPRVTYTCVCYKSVDYHKSSDCCYSGMYGYKHGQSYSTSAINNDPRLNNPTRYWYYRNGVWTQNP